MEHLDLAGILTTPLQWNVPAIFDQQDAIYLSNSRQMLEPIMEETSEDEEHALNSWNHQAGSDSRGIQEVEREEEFSSTAKTERNNFWSSNDSETGSVIRIELTKESDSISERDYLCPAKRAKRSDELYQISNSLDEDAVVLRRSNNNNNNSNNLERFLSYDCCSRSGESWSISNSTSNSTSNSSNREPQRNSTGSRRFDEFYSDSDSLSYNSLSRSSSLIQFESLERQLLLQEQHSSMNSLGNSSPSLLNFDGQLNDDLTLTSCKTNSNSGYNSRRGSQSSLLKRYESTDGRLHQTYYDLDKLNFDEMNGPNNNIGSLLSTNNNNCGSGIINAINSNKYNLIIPELRSDSESSTTSSENSSRIGGNSKMASIPGNVDNELKMRIQLPNINSYQRRGSKNSVENLSEDSGYGEPVSQTVTNHPQHQWFILGRSKSQNLPKYNEQLYVNDTNGDHNEGINKEAENPVEHSKINANVEHFSTNVKIATTTASFSSSTSTSPLIMQTTATQQVTGTSTKRSVTEKHHAHHPSDLNNEKIKTETFVESMRANNNDNDNNSNDEHSAVAALTHLFKNSRLQPRDFHLGDNENEHLMDEELSDTEIEDEYKEDSETVLRHRHRQRSQTHSPSPVSSEASSVNTKNSSTSTSSTSPSSCTSATTCASAASFTWLMPQSNIYNSHNYHYHNFDHYVHRHHTIFERSNSLPDIRDKCTTTINEETFLFNSNCKKFNRDFHSNKTESANIIRTKPNKVNVNGESGNRDSNTNANRNLKAEVFDIKSENEIICDFRVINNNNLENNTENIIKSKVMFKETNWMWWSRDKVSNNNSLPESLNNCCKNESFKIVESRNRRGEFQQIKRSSSCSSLNYKCSNKDCNKTSAKSPEVFGVALDHINASYYNLSDLEEFPQKRNKIADRHFTSYTNDLPKSLRMESLGLDKLDGGVIVEETQELLCNENEDLTEMEKIKSNAKLKDVEECVQHVQLVLRYPTARQNKSDEINKKTISLTQELITTNTPGTPERFNKTFDQDPTNLRTSYAQSLEKCNFDPIELSSYNDQHHNQQLIRNLPKRRFQSHISYQNKKNFVSSTPNLNAYQANYSEQIEDDLYVSSAHTSMHQLPQNGASIVTGKPLGILLPVGPRNSNKEVSFCPVVSKYSWQEQSSEEYQDINVTSAKIETGTETEIQKTETATPLLESTNNHLINNDDGDSDSDDELLDNADATVIFNTKNNEMIAKCFHENIKQQSPQWNAMKHEIIQQKHHQEKNCKIVDTNKIPFANGGIEIEIEPPSKEQQKADVTSTKCKEMNSQRKEENTLIEINDGLVKEESANNYILEIKSINDRENETTVIQELSNENEHENEMEVKHVLLKTSTITTIPQVTPTATTSNCNIIEVIDNNKTTTMISQTHNVNKEGDVSLKVALVNNNNIHNNNCQNETASNEIGKHDKTLNENQLKKPIVILARPLSIQLPVLSEPPRNRAQQILYASQQMLNENLSERNCEKLKQVNRETSTINRKLNSNRMENKGLVDVATSTNVTNTNAIITRNINNQNNNNNNNNEIMKSKFKADEKHPNAKSFLARFANGFRFSLRRNKKKLQQQQQQKLQQNHQQQQQSTTQASTSKPDFIYIPLKGPLPNSGQRQYKANTNVNVNANINANQLTINGNDVDNIGAKQVKTTTTSCNSGKSIVVEQKVTGKPPIPGKQYQSAQSKLTKMLSPPPAAPSLLSRTAASTTAALTVGASRFYTFEDNNTNNTSMVHGRTTTTELNTEFLNTERSYCSSSPSTNNKQFATATATATTKANKPIQKESEVLTTADVINENEGNLHNNYSNVSVNIHVNGGNDMTDECGENVLTLTSSPSRVNVTEKMQMFNHLAAAGQDRMQNSSTPLQNKQHQLQPAKIGLIETNLDTHETVITGKTCSLINIDITPPSHLQAQSKLQSQLQNINFGQQQNEQIQQEQQQQQQWNDDGPNRFAYMKKKNFTGNRTNGNHQRNTDGNGVVNSLYNNHNNNIDDEDEVIVQPDGTMIVLKNSGIGVGVGVGSNTNHHQIASVRRPHKSMEFLLDKENQKNILPPENELQKSHDQNPAALSEHQLRIQASLQRLNIPDWFRQYNQTQANATDGGGGGIGAGAYRPGNFTRKRTQDSGRWAGLNSKTTSLSSLGSQRSDRSPLLLSPSAHSHHGGQSVSHQHHYHPHHSHHVGSMLSASIIGSAGEAETGRGSGGASAGTGSCAFSRWSTSHLNSSQISPCVSQRSSFSRGGPINSSFISIASGHNTSAIRNSMRQPYLGWRSQEKLSQRTAHERLASSLLLQQQQNQQQQQRTSPSARQTLPCITNQDEIVAQNKLPPPITPEIQSSIKEVTSAIVHYVNDQTNQQRSRSTSPNSSYL